MQRSIAFWVVLSLIALVGSSRPAAAHNATSVNGPQSMATFFEVTVYAQLGSPADGATYASGVDSVFSPDSEHKYRLKNTSPFSWTLIYDRSLQIRHYNNAMPPTPTAIGDATTSNISWPSNAGQTIVVDAATAGISSTIYNPVAGTYSATASTQITAGGATLVVEHWHHWTRQ